MLGRPTANTRDPACWSCLGTRQRIAVEIPERRGLPSPALCQSHCCLEHDLFLRIAENAQEPLLVNRTTATKDKIQNIRSPHFKKQDGIFFCFSAGPQQGRGPAGRRQMSRHGAKGLISGEQDTLSIKEGCRGRRTIPRPGCRASACDIWACPGLGGCWTVGRSP